MFYDNIIIIVDILYFDKIITDIIQVNVKMFNKTDCDDQITVPIFRAHVQRLV